MLDIVEPDKPSPRCTSLKFTGGGKQVLATSADGTVLVWDTQSGALATELNAVPASVLDASPNSSGIVLVTPEGSLRTIIKEGRTARDPSLLGLPLRSELPVSSDYVSAVVTTPGAMLLADHAARLRAVPHDGPSMVTTIGGGLASSLSKHLLPMARRSDGLAGASRNP